MYDPRTSNDCSYITTLSCPADWATAVEFRETEENRTLRPTGLNLIVVTGDRTTAPTVRGDQTTTLGSRLIFATLVFVRWKTAAIDD